MHRHAADFTDEELKLYYVIPPGHWEIKTGPGAEAVAAFDSHGDANRFLEMIGERSHARRLESKDPGPRE